MAIFTLILIFTSSLTLADTLFKEGDYFNAITEYKRALFLGSIDSIYGLSMIGLSYELRQKPDFALRYWGEVNYLKNDKLSSLHVAYNLLQLGRYRECMLALGSSSDTLAKKVKAVALGLQGEESRAEVELKFLKVEPLQIPSKKFLIISSLIAPGSGLIMLGDYKRGFMTAAFTGASAYLVAYLLKQKRYTEALLSFNVFFLRFYMGNIQNTMKMRRNRIKKFYLKLEREIEAELLNKTFKKLTSK